MNRNNHNIFKGPHEEFLNLLFSYLNRDELLEFCSTHSIPLNPELGDVRDLLELVNDAQFDRIAGYLVEIGAEPKGAFKLRSYHPRVTSSGYWGSEDGALESASSSNWFVSVDSFLGEPLPVAGPGLVALEDEDCPSDQPLAFGDSWGFQSIDNLLGVPIPIASFDLECLEEPNASSQGWSRSVDFQSIDSLLGVPIPVSSSELECLEGSPNSSQVWECSTKFQTVDSDVSVLIPTPELEYQQESSNSTDVRNISFTYEPLESILGVPIPTSLAELEALEEPTSSDPVNNSIRWPDWRETLEEAEAHFTQRIEAATSTFLNIYLASSAGDDSDSSFLSDSETDSDDGSSNVSRM